MSVTFNLADFGTKTPFGSERADRVELPDFDSPLWINMANGNARDLLGWLELEETDELCGGHEIADLAARCRRRLWTEDRNNDPGRPEVVDKQPGLATLIICERRPGYLREKTEALLQLCEHGIAQGFTHVFWS